MRINVVILPQGAHLPWLNSLRTIVNPDRGPTGKQNLEQVGHLPSRGGAGTAGLSADARTNSHLISALIFFLLKSSPRGLWDLGRAGE